jgi:hypothetical protein
MFSFTAPFSSHFDALYVQGLWILPLPFVLLIAVIFWRDHRCFHLDGCIF